MKTYNWQVTNLYTLDEGTETDYVVTALYEVAGTETIEGVEYTASLSNSAHFDVVQGDTFVPYEDLTNAIVVEWVQAQLGADGVTNTQLSIAGMIDSEITPPVNPQNTPLPSNFN